ncbi:MAG: DUF2878 domain-containing protein [Comamonadaceae bacterium]|jgi:hypothetical protein|uniref:DUF2878 domain-containing protein n=1 Tax=Hydrogenophaga sp. SNF1 TaxID=3098762 RepID=UPI002ACC2B64|nr:DUF2878 domain-containing protein [Hydrogenophaga sp. SNF1]NCT95990.1 DUF2878 domain-containing protein [Comamonadaceae bacterium]WQB82311.1 DUF2878 domain-containing protein [Hydrogenophaga sp. SNF1]
MSAPQPTPDRRWQWSNVLWTQLAWFAAVLGAAHGVPAWGTLPALAVLLWHLRRAPRPRSEAVLMLLAAGLGTLADTLVLHQGVLAFASGQWSAALPPPWMSALWAVFATSLNVTLRWLHGRPLLAAALGAVAGPLAFLSGARLGAAQLLEPGVAMALLSLQWALVLPVLALCARRLDGVAAPAPSAGTTRTP